MKSNKTHGVYTLLIVIFVFTAVSLFISYNQELKKKPIIADKIASGDAGYLYNFYVNPRPQLYEDFFLGSSGAPINVILYLDLSSETAVYFYDEIFPRLDEDYIKTNLVRFYPKNIVGFTDFKEKNFNFIQSVSLRCAGRIKKNVYTQFYLGLIKTKSIAEIKDLASNLKIPAEEFEVCMEGGDIDYIKEQVSESENFGLQGINAKFFIGITGTEYQTLDGIPSYTRLARLIREFETIVGN
jgi:hypothetical protein